MSSIKKIKIIIDSEIRKFKFDSETQTHDDLLTKIYQLWKQKHPNTKPKTYASLITKYLDLDNDWITFSSVAEWKELLEDMNGSPSIKISVETPSFADTLPGALEDSMKQGEEFFKQLRKNPEVEKFLKDLTKGDLFKNFFKNGKCSTGKKCEGFESFFKKGKDGKFNPVCDFFKNFQCQGKKQTENQDQKSDEKKPKKTEEKVEKPKVEKPKYQPTFQPKTEIKKEKEETKEQPQKESSSAPKFNGEKFGASIQSFLPFLNEAFSNVHAQPVEKKEYKTEMDQLKKMGFLDEKQNMSYLQKYRGDIKRVVAEYFK